MKKLAHFFETPKGAFIKNSSVCFGASVVLMGALFKIMHWPGAGPMLCAGMLTEVVLFALFGLLPPHKDYHWEKLYPGIDVAPDIDPDFDPEALRASKPKAEKKSLTQELDTMLEKSKVEPELIERLGDNLRKLGENMAKLSDSSDASAATNQYSTKAKEAAAALDEMKDAYSEATKAVSALSAVSADTQKYQQEVQAVAQNLSALNAVYEMELQDSNKHFKIMNQYHGNLAAVMETLNDSVKDTEKYKQEMSNLANNLSSLNTVYGNMLSAMTNPMAARGNM